jgi:hypothetical protein
MVPLFKGWLLLSQPSSTCLLHGIGGHLTEGASPSLISASSIEARQGIEPCYRQLCRLSLTAS